MNNKWEETFARWSTAPPDTEQARNERMVAGVKDAIALSGQLKARSVKPFVQGSYRNRVNIRTDSDVDIGVVCNDVFFDRYPLGKSKEDFGLTEASYTYSQFKKELYDALIAKFGSKAVEWGNKALKVHFGADKLYADVVPLFEFRQYWEGGSYRAGVALRPDNGLQIENYPERLFSYWPNTPLHYENGVKKNEDTGRAFKGVVRILKKLRVEMDEQGIASAKPISGYLIECLTYNTSNTKLKSNSWCERVEGVVQNVWINTYNEDQGTQWTEVDEIKYLFRPTQPWKRSDVFSFMIDVKKYLDIP